MTLLSSSALLPATALAGWIAPWRDLYNPRP